MDLFEIGNFKSVEELVSQINNEYEALNYYDNLFSQIEEMKSEIYEGLYELEERFSIKIDVDYLFENLDVFLESYINPQYRLNTVYATKQITKSLEELVRTQNCSN